MRSALTLGSQRAERAVVINDMVEGERENEERAVSGGVHLKSHIPLVQPNCLTLFCQRCLQQLPSYLEYNEYTEFTFSRSLIHMQKPINAMSSRNVTNLETNI